MHRRDFLKTTAAALITPRLSASEFSSFRVFESDKPRGIQLYSVRFLMEKHPERTLDTIAKIGYTEVELAGTYGKTAKQFRVMLDNAGLKAPSGHIDLPLFKENMQRTLDDAQTLGHHWPIVAWIDQEDRTVERLTRIAGFFNEIGEAADKRGMRFAYHNHNFEFTPVSGVLPYDLLLERTDRKLVEFEIDLFWMREGGKDPLAYFARYPGRFPALHIKDMSADGKQVNVGEGVIDFKRVLAKSEQAGIKHYYVEHDEPNNPIDFARKSYKALTLLLNS